MIEKHEPQLANLCLVTDRQGNINETYAFITNSPEETKKIMNDMRPVRAGQTRTIFTNLVPIQVDDMTAGETRIFEMQTGLGLSASMLLTSPIVTKVEEG